MTRHVYFFGAGEADGRGDQKMILGGKGAGLAEMTALGIPVPPGFTLTTEVSAHYDDNDGNYPEGIEKHVSEALDRVWKSAGLTPQGHLAVPAEG